MDLCTVTHCVICLLCYLSGQRCPLPLLICCILGLEEACFLHHQAHRDFLRSPVSRVQDIVPFKAHGLFIHGGCCFYLIVWIVIPFTSALSWEGDLLECQQRPLKFTAEQRVNAHAHNVSKVTLSCTNAIVYGTGTRPLEMYSGFSLLWGHQGDHEAAPSWMV